MTSIASQERPLGLVARAKERYQAAVPDEMAFDSDRSPLAILDEIDRHPRGDALAELVHTLAFSAYDERRTTLDVGLDDAASRLSVDEAGSETSFGNVMRALRKGPRATAPERILLGALVARGIAIAPPAGDQAEDRVAHALAWIASHTVTDPLVALDAALDSARRKNIAEDKTTQSAAPFWAALARAVRHHDEGGADPEVHGATRLDRPSAIVAAAALAKSVAARPHLLPLRGTLRDPVLASLLSEPSAAAPTEGPAPMVGTIELDAEETSPPRRAVWTILLAITFILPIVSAARLFARYALRLRRPAKVSISNDGIRVKSRTELLGKTLGEHEVFVPRDALSKVSREVRFPRLAVYAGIAALVIGSIVGVRFTIDGARSGSPELLVVGLLFTLGGLAIDYALTLLPGLSPKRCRMLFESQKGDRVAIRNADRTIADRALEALGRAVPR